ncbi:cache domain-containing sensor histidine kinase [Gracilibacillus massiliensis]|uniref:cache domain-containing sensor histidine kinase n=1 Tax=Gracilibacillus massiliensis TaxID=1564956 RepID=UPI00071CB97E|nr:sensor histidine kinase [Gracilibacillus massiliensis]
MIFKYFRNSKLMSKLMITYIILTVIPVSILGYIAYKQYTLSIENQVGEYIPKLLEQANININNQLNDYRSLPDSLYNSSDVIEVLRKDAYQNNSALFRDEFLVNNALSRMYMTNGNSDILGVFILSNNRLFQSTNKTETGFQTEEFSSFLGDTFDLNGGTDFILPNQTDLKFENNPPFLLMMRELRDYENQENLGTMFIAIRLDFIERAMKGLTADRDPSIWLTNGSGNIIYHSDSDKIGEIDTKFSQYPKVNGSFRTTNWLENDLISSYKFPSVNWYSFHKIPLRELMEDTNLVRNGTIIVFIIIVVLSTIISVLLAWNVSNPLKKLTVLMKRVEKGDFKVDLPMDKKDEIGILAKSFNSMIQEIEYLIRENYQIELKQKDAELYALQSQINPHFMYNTLETIAYAVEEEEKDEVVEMVTILGRMLRYSINNKEKTVSIHKELSHTKDYLTIQRFRFEDRIEFFIETDVDADEYVIPKFILQPVIENAIKYGLEQSIKIHIEVTIIVNELDELEIRIKDNGPGMTEAELKQIHLTLDQNPMKRMSQFGLLNVHARIKMMYGDSYGLAVNSHEGKGTTVVLHLPLDDDRKKGVS